MFQVKSDVSKSILVSNLMTVFLNYNCFQVLFPSSVSKLKTKSRMWIQNGKRSKYLESLSIWRKALDNFNSLLFRNGNCPPCFISIENECIYLDTTYGLFGNYVSRNEAQEMCSEYQSELLDSYQLIGFSSTVDGLIESQYQAIGSGKSSAKMNRLNSINFNLKPKLLFLRENNEIKLSVNSLLRTSFILDG